MKKYFSFTVKKGEEHWTSRESLDIQGFARCSYARPEKNQTELL
jgi:hypothetical protein